MKLGFFIVFFCTHLSAQSLTDIANPELNTPYKSGSEICQNLRGEHPLWVPVPTHYEDKQSDQSLIYAWTKKPFNYKLKTMVFVSGGPGNHEHESLFDLVDWNVVFLINAALPVLNRKINKFI